MRTADNIGEARPASCGVALLKDERLAEGAKLEMGDPRVT
jgi:hypothetical protein